jgi:anti-sigma factor RsiW
MTAMGGHLGPRVSALLDGQLDEQETERAWAHVHGCHLCRDQVEREGWVKTRLAGSSLEPVAVPESLRGALLGMPPGDVLMAMAGRRPEPSSSRTRRTVGLAAIGGSAAGAAVMGVLALGAAPADVPNVDRRLPSSQVTTPTQPPAKLPTRPFRTGG